MQTPSLTHYHWLCKRTCRRGDRSLCPPEDYLAGLRTPAPELVLAEYRLRTNGGAVPAAPPAPVDDVPADTEVNAGGRTEGGRWPAEPRQ